MHATFNFSLVRLCLAFLALILAATAASSEMQPPVPSYDIRVAMVPEQRRLTVATGVTLSPLPETRETLRFKLRTDMGTPRVRLVGPKAAGRVTVRKISDTGDETEWEIRPGAPFPAGQPISLQIHAAGGDKISLLFYVGPEVVFVYGGATPWHPQFSGARGVGTLTLDMPASFSAPTTVERISERVRGGQRSVQFRLSRPGPFSFTAGPYKVRKAAQKAGERSVSLYLLQDREYSANLAETARRSIVILEKEFGAFPYTEFAVVEVPSEPAQKSGFIGAGYPGYMLMRADYMDRKRDDPFFFGHEIGHQWWGGSITNAGTTGEFMLDEALAQYGALRVVEELRGPDEARAFRAGEGEYQGATDAMNLILTGTDEPLANLPKKPEFYELSDTKGYLVYDLISRVIGRNRMRAFFSDISSTYASSSLSWEDYLARLKKHAGPENQWLLDQWVNQKGFPVLSSQWVAENGGVAVEINQVQKDAPLYRLQLPVRLTYADGSAEVRMVEVAGAQAKVRLAASKPVARVDLDPDRTVPWVSAQEWATSTALKHATRGKFLWDHGQTPDAEKMFKAALDARTAPDATPAEFLERFYYGWIIEEAGKLSEAIEQYQRALSLPVRDEWELGQLYLNLARAASKKGDKALANWAAQAAIAWEETRTDQGVRTIGERVRKYMS